MQYAYFFSSYSFKVVHKLSPLNYINVIAIFFFLLRKKYVKDKKRKESTKKL